MSPISLTFPLFSFDFNKRGIPFGGKFSCANPYMKAGESASCLFVSDSLQPHGVSLEFFRQEYWSGLPFSSLGDLPDPGIEPGSPTLQPDCLPSELPGKLSHEDMYVLVAQCIRLFVTPWTEARQTSLSMGFSRPEYRGGLPFPSPGDLPDPGIEPISPVLQADSLHTEPLAKSYMKVYTLYNDPIFYP